MTPRARLLAPLGTLLAVTAVAVAVHAVGGRAGGPTRTVLHLRAGSAAATSELTPTVGKARGSGGDNAGGATSGGDSGYRVVGVLPGAGPADGPVWDLPGGRADAALVRRLAAALGAGTPVRAGAGWRAGALTVTATPGQPWYWSPGCAPPQADPGAPPVVCASSGGSVAVGTATGGSGSAGTATTSTGTCGPALGAPAGPGTPVEDLAGSADGGCGSVPTMIDPPLTDPGLRSTSGLGTVEPAPPVAEPGAHLPSGDPGGPPPQPMPPVGQPPTAQAPDLKPSGQQVPPAKPPASPSLTVVRTAVAPVLRALGLDPAAAHVTGGEVRLDPMLDGLPTAGWATRLQVAADGTLTAGTGWLARPTRGAAYPLVGARAALDALPEPPRMLMPCPAPACSPEPVREVTGARRGVVLQMLQGGAPLLLPAWLFDIRGADEPLVAVAVAPRWWRVAEPGAPDSTR